MRGLHPFLAVLALAFRLRLRVCVESTFTGVLQDRPLGHLTFYLGCLHHKDTVWLLVGTDESVFDVCTIKHVVSFSAYEIILLSALV